MEPKLVGGFTNSMWPGNALGSPPEDPGTVAGGRDRWMSGWIVQWMDGWMDNEWNAS